MRPGLRRVLGPIGRWLPAQSAFRPAAAGPADEWSWAQAGLADRQVRRLDARIPNREQAEQRFLHLQGFGLVADAGRQIDRERVIGQVGKIRDVIRLERG